MSFFDLISELRTRDARPEKAAKAMKVLAAICLFGGIGNYVVVLIAPFDRSPIKIDPNYPAIALITGALLSGLFFLASRGIKERAGWGKRLGQLAVALLIAAVVLSFIRIFWDSKFPSGHFPRPFLIVFLLICVAQFGVPAYFGIRYLGRLPVDENSYVIRPAARPGIPPRPAATGFERRQPPAAQIYKEAPVPFGVAGTFIVQMAIFMIVMIAAQQHENPVVFAAVFAVLFSAIFLGPALYNRVPSGFERARTVAASYTGGGSLLLFHGSWPFFRLLVYGDGVEVRVMFHRFFIPYDKMEDLPEKMGFFSSGILFKSDLPGVPSRIRFSGFGMKKILADVRERRKKFLAVNAGSLRPVDSEAPKGT